MRNSSGCALIVSAEPAFSEPICRALERLGIDTVQAPDAVGAVSHLSQGMPGAVLIDFRFQDMDPMQIVHRAVACRELYGMPVIALGDSVDDRDELIGAGCGAILSRDTAPATVADLVARLMRIPDAGNGAVEPPAVADRRPRLYPKLRRSSTMKAAVFVAPGRIVLEDRPIPKPGPRDAVLRVTTTTICGTDVHILNGEYPVAPGRIVGHEPVGVIAELGSAVTGYEIGQRVIAGAITPCGQCDACLGGNLAQCGGRAMGGWKLGNSIDGCQAEYALIPDATANLAPIPDGLADEQVLMCPDIMSTGFGGAENSGIRIGDAVAIFAQGPIGLCATVGARLCGATTIITVDAVAERLTMSRRLGADVTVDYQREDPVARIVELTGGRGVDVAIEALGTQTTFENCLRVLRPGGTLSSLGVYSGKLTMPLDAFAAGLGDHTIATTLCPGGKNRMRRLMSVLASGRADLAPLVTHRFALDQIEAAYELFAHQRDGVLKVAITP